MSGQIPMCHECRFWVSLSDIAGECHFHAPVFTVERDATWPETASDEFCGEGEFA